MSNPFFETWDTPPFSRIRSEHYKPAYERALTEHKSEIARIAADPAAPTFANTILALEKSGRLLTRVEAVFSNLVSADGNEALQAIELAMAPVLAQHWNEIYLNAALFTRIDRIYGQRNGLGLDAEQRRVLERYYLDFVRAGANLSEGKKARLAGIIEKLASLATQFAQNVLADEQSSVIELTADDVAGLPDIPRQSAAALAKELNLKSPFAVTAGRSSAEAFLRFAERRDLREKVFEAWINRGNHDNKNNNASIITETIRLRDEQAKLLGYENYAQYKLDDTMARTPAQARALLDKVWQPALKQARAERQALQTVIAEEGSNFPLAAWDWRFYSEKLRKLRYDIDEAEIQPYLQLENVIQAAFEVASRLFRLSFHRRDDVPVYHPDVRVWEVRRDGKFIGHFFGDYFARPSKRSGAWMSSFRNQENLDEAVMPIVVNVCNFPKGDPALLSFEDAKTLFHEFGHALHGLLSDVGFPRLAGTNVARDFVELPSQIYEHWLEQPEILERFAVHYQSGKPMPRALLDKLVAARNFNQGFSTVEFLGSAFFDLDVHEAADAPQLDLGTLKNLTEARIGMPAEIPMRHGPSHFLHVFSGDGYSAGYYSYLWAEVLDADGFEAFKSSGDIFNPSLAEKLYTYVYSSGGTRDFADSYRKFRGRDPEIDALLAGRGLTAA